MLWEKKEIDQRKGEDEGQVVVLNKVVMVGLIEKVISQQRFKGVKRESPENTGERVLQTEGMASAKGLRWECALCVDMPKNPRCQ